jgi:hypothetical protein
MPLDHSFGRTQLAMSVYGYGLLDQIGYRIVSVSSFQARNEALRQRRTVRRLVACRLIVSNVRYGSGSGVGRDGIQNELTRSQATSVVVSCIDRVRRMNQDSCWGHNASQIATGERLRLELMPRAAPLSVTIRFSEAMRREMEQTNFHTRDSLQAPTSPKTSSLAERR